jgi:hypothetical protein
MNLLTLPARAISCCLVALALSGPALADKITVWVDDEHTQQTKVDKLDPDQIADPSSFSIGLGGSLGQIGISVGWSKEQGVEYDAQAQALIKKIRALCEEFNKGELSLESYQRRVRRIFNAIEAARVCSMELAVNNKLAALKASDRLDEALNLSPIVNSEFEQEITAAMDEFRTLVETIRPHDIPLPTESAIFDSANISDFDRSKSAVRDRLADLDAALKPKPIRSKRDRKLINIWKDKARTTQIAVPMLDTEDLVEEFEQSLCLQMKYSPPLVAVYMGDEVSWTLQAKAKYDEAAQLLIVKYRKLCLEYNSTLISQEGYFERLVELMEAERRAFAAREEMTKRLNERKDAMGAELDKLRGGSDSLVDKLRKGRDGKRSKTEEIQRGKRGPSAVEEISKAARSDMKAWDAFVESVGEFRVDPPSDSVDVWVDDTMGRKISVPKLDTDIIASSVKTRLKLQISFFNLGPECSWAREKGLDYGYAAQLVILKSKRLCTDYNSGLISQETYLRTSRQIDASVEKAAAVRQGLIKFYTTLKDTGRKRALKLIDRNRDRSKQ